MPDSNRAYPRTWSQPSMSRSPLALTDTQLDIVFRLAATLLVADRPAFMEDVPRGR
jgi:hypothetical protein